MSQQKVTFWFFNFGSFHTWWMQIFEWNLVLHLSRNHVEEGLLLIKRHPSSSSRGQLELRGRCAEQELFLNTCLNNSSNNILGELGKPRNHLRQWSETFVWNQLFAYVVEQFFTEIKLIHFTNPAHRRRFSHASAPTPSLNTNSAAFRRSGVRRSKH